jgi:hypothetical protein
MKRIRGIQRKAGMMIASMDMLHEKIYPLPMYVSKHGDALLVPLRGPLKPKSHVRDVYDQMC